MAIRCIIGLLATCTLTAAIEPTVHLVWPPPKSIQASGAPLYLHDDVRVVLNKGG